MLSVAALGLSYTVAQYGNTLGVALIAGMIGLALIVGAVANPAFGFYTCIVVGFYISILERFMNNGLSLDPAVDILIFASYLGVLVKNRVRHESMWEKAAHPITYFYLVFVLCQLPCLPFLPGHQFLFLFLDYYGGALRRLRLLSEICGFSGFRIKLDQG
jgi:hypothetical protein